jgi:hypothetical protein
MELKVAFYCIALVPPGLYYTDKKEMSTLEGLGMCITPLKNDMFWCRGNNLPCFCDFEEIYKKVGKEFKIDYEDIIQSKGLNI